GCERGLSRQTSARRGGKSSGDTPSMAGVRAAARLSRKLSVYRSSCSLWLSFLSAVFRVRFSNLSFFSWFTLSSCTGCIFRKVPAGRAAVARWAVDQQGSLEDVEHDSLEILLGGEFEAIVCVLKRPRQA